MRNDGRRVVRNNLDLYEQMLEERDVKYFRHYVTPNFQYPTKEQMREFLVLRHVWKKGDRFFKLAHKHYGDSRLWWVLAWFNKKPTETHVNLGDIILVPKPLTTLMKYLRNK